MWPLGLISSKLLQPGSDAHGHSTWPIVNGGGCLDAALIDQGKIERCTEEAKKKKINGIRGFTAVPRD